jgi:hypothetical protein
MSIVLVLVSALVIVLTLWDAFEAMILPRRVTRFYRPARFFYRTTWRIWRTAALLLPAGKKRHAFLSLFGPLSLPGLFATWFATLIFGFALLHWSLGTDLRTPEGPPDFWTYVYFSGGTYFTVGAGDLTAATSAARVLAVIEAGTGLGFLAVVIGYLPALYQAFSTREMTISLLDARAGSPPSASQLLLRSARAGQLAAAGAFLAEWERWSAGVLESHLSFPVLSFYRSQHDNQSWLAALTAVLDTCAILIVAVKDGPEYQARLTFAMARHAAVDLALVFKTPPLVPDERLSRQGWQHLQQQLRDCGLELREGPEVDARFAELRAMYEPFVNALAQYLWLSLPAIVPATTVIDNWQTSAWTRRTPGIGGLARPEDEHF